MEAGWQRSLMFKIIIAVCAKAKEKRREKKIKLGIDFGGRHVEVE